MKVPKPRQNENSEELDWPGGQLKQEEALVAATDAPYLPLSQLTQAAADVDPVSVLYVPASHGLQLAEPATALNRPAGQIWQAESTLFAPLPAAQLRQEMQKFPLRVTPAEDAKVVPAESFTPHVFSLGYSPAVA